MLVTALLATLLSTAPLTVTDAATGSSFRVEVKNALWCALWPSALSAKTDCSGFKLEEAAASFDKAPADNRIRSILVGAGDMQSGGELFLSALILKVDKDKPFDVPDYVRSVRAASQGDLEKGEDLVPVRFDAVAGCSFTTRHKGPSSANAITLMIPIAADSILEVTFRGPASTLSQLLLQQPTLVTNITRKAAKPAILGGCAATKPDVRKKPAP
jgi:hypothetical protein